MRTAIILLNWNGADDTIACLNSLVKAQGDIQVVLVDNASSDNSLQRFDQWKSQHQQFPLSILPQPNNHGFAKGCNIGIRYAAAFNPKYYFLLNNDTEVEPDFLLKMLEFAKDNSKYKVLTPQINYFYDKKKVWLCGGILTFGSRKRLYHNADEHDIKEQTHIPVSFISGCALLAHKSLLMNDGNLLTERYFFGEEDFDFSLRMQKRHIPMACVPTSKIYHKVGSSMKSAKSNTQIGRSYSFYLGKMLCCKEHYPSLSFALLKCLILPKSFVYFYKSTKSMSKALSLTSNLARDINTKTGITQEYFLKLLSWDRK